MTENPVNPEARFPGTTWVPWGVGRGPVGVDTTQTEFDTVGKTGGLKEVGLTASNNGPHAHPLTQDFKFAAGGTAATIGYIPGSTSYTTGTSGEGTPHNNLQPYQTCYFWKRTA